jgi:non-homologous end joining protein Ku
VRKLIAFDDDTFDKLKQLGRDRMATIQELADEAFADVLRKHNIPIDLKDALRKSAALSKSPAKKDEQTAEKMAKKTAGKTAKNAALKNNARSRKSKS